MATKRLILSGTDGTESNKYAYVQKESDKFFFVSIQDKITLERHTRAFSKKTLKCVSNTSNFTKRLKIEKFI